MASRPDDPLDELYRSPLRDWVGQRKRIAARLAKEGRAGDAKAIASADKPKATVWAINRVARTSPKAMARLLTTSDALKSAQLRAPDKMSAASAAFREATEAVVHEAIAAMKDAGLATTLDSHRRIANTLRGAATSARGALTDGRLAEEIAPGGFELFAGATPQGRRRLRSVPAKPATTTPPRDDHAHRRAGQLEAEASSRAWDAQRATEALSKARRELRELEQKARAAARTATKSRQQATRARQRAQRGGISRTRRDR